MRWIYWTIATALGSGFSPLAPGTAGSLLAVIIAYGFIPAHAVWNLPFATVVVFLLGIPAATQVARSTRQTDPQIVVIDEVVGMWLSLWWLPKSIGWYGLAFVTFRLLDIWKPFPIRQVEHLGEGLGIMLDDVLAGAYALVILQGIHYFIH